MSLLKSHRYYMIRSNGKKSFPQIVEKTVEKNTAAPVMYVKKRMGTNEIP